MDQQSQQSMQEPSRDANEEWCGVTCAIRTIDHKWHPVIVDRLLEHEVLRFNELLDEIGEVSNKTLSVSLADLEEKNVVARDVVATRPVHVEYSLTEHGKTLAPVIDALDEWGRTHTTPSGEAKTATESHQSA